MARHLAYTLALDHPPGAVGHRTMAKLLVLSLLRTRFPGEIVVFKNTPQPLFLVPRAGVREVLVEPEPPGDEHFWDYAQAWKFRVAHHLDVRGCDKVLFLDADCLALRGLDALLAEEWELAFYPEPKSWAGSKWFNCFVSEEEAASRPDAPGINGGVLAVRAELYHDVMAQWQAIHFGPAPREKFFTDQAALTRLVLDTPLRQRVLGSKDLATPFGYDPHPQRYFEANLVHLAGCEDFNQKLRFMFGLYLNTFFFDRQATLMHLLEM